MKLFINLQVQVYANRIIGKMKENDTVLVHAGGSGVGTAAVQLIKLAKGKPKRHK